MIQARAGQRRGSRSAALAAVAAMLAAALVAPAAAGASTGSLAWEPCHETAGGWFGVSYECATMWAPLDHERDDTETTPLVAVEVIRLRATGPDPIGSLVLNPGGPGGSGVDFAVFFGPFAGDVFGPEVRDRFDIVGFDPRGIHRSTAIRCFDTLEDQIPALYPAAYPSKYRDVGAFADADAYLADRCSEADPAIAEHMSTANVARDMDLLREALGDEQLTYLGISYGTLLGQTYANLFPDRVRSVVIDGVLDPESWANLGGEVPFSTALNSAQGAQDTLTEVLRLCDEAGPSVCPAAPGAADLWTDLHKELDKRPLEVPHPSGTPVTLDDVEFVNFSLGMLYAPFGWPALADVMAGVRDGVEGEELSARFPWSTAEGVDGDGRDGPPAYANWLEGFPAVMCTDSDNPETQKDWWKAAKTSAKDTGGFGLLWTFISAPCAEWPFADEDRYVGPWSAATANPVLIVGNLYDPATPYHMAVRARELLPNSALVTVDLPAHAAFDLHPCVSSTIAEYLLDPTTAPVAGRFCEAGPNWFELLHVPEATSGEGMSAARSFDLRHQAAWASPWRR